MWREVFVQLYLCSRSLDAKRKELKKRVYREEGKLRERRANKLLPELTHGTRRFHGDPHSKVLHKLP